MVPKALSPSLHNRIYNPLDAPPPPPPPLPCFSSFSISSSIFLYSFYIFSCRWNGKICHCVSHTTHLPQIFKIKPYPLPTPTSHPHLSPCFSSPSISCYIFLYNLSMFRDLSGLRHVLNRASNPEKTHLIRCSALKGRTECCKSAYNCG